MRKLLNKFFGPKYILEPKLMLHFQCIVLLEYLCNQVSEYKKETDPRLVPALEELRALGFIGIDLSNTCHVTQEGRAALRNFLSRYDDYLINFEIYSVVDPITAELPFSNYAKYENTAVRNKYFSDKRYGDARFFVAQHKKMFLPEVVFMSLCAEEPFDPKSEVWKEVFFDNILVVEKTILARCKKILLLKLIGAAGHKMETLIKNGAAANLKNRFIAPDGETKPKEDLDNGPVEAPDYDMTNLTKYLDPNYLAPCWSVNMFYSPKTNQ